MKKIAIKHKASQFGGLVAITKASILSTLRSPSSLFFNFVFPFIFISVFGLLGQGSGKYEVAMREESLRSGTLYEILSKIETLDLKTFSNDEIDEKLNKGQIPAAITITENGKLDVAPGQQIDKYSLKLEKSAADPQDAEIIASIIDSVTKELNTPPQAESFELVKTEINVVEGRKYTQIDFILPGQLAFALLSNALFGISITLITLKKELVIKRIFSTPTSAFTILLGEALGKIIIAILQAILIILVGHYLFDFTLANGVWTLLSMLGLSLVGIFTFLSFGLFVSTLGKDEESVAPISNLIMMPQLFLSGAFFPIDAFPEFLQPIARVLPMTFLNEAFKKVAFEGVQLSETLPEIGGLLVWAAIMYLVVMKLFKWE